MTFHRLSQAAVIAACLAGVSASFAQAEFLIDQSFVFDPNVSGGDVFIRPSTPRAQTITAGLTGQLAQVDVLVNRWSSNANSTPLILEVWSLSGTSLTSSLGSASLPVTEVPFFQSAGFESFDLSAENIQIAAGEQFAILLTTAGLSSQYGWRSMAAGTYSGGAGYLVSGTSLITPSGDFGFRTYVDTAPSAVPVPGTLTLAGLGALSFAIGDAWRRWRQRESCTKSAGHGPGAC